MMTRPASAMWREVEQHKVAMNSVQLNEVAIKSYQGDPDKLRKAHVEKLRE